MGQTISVRQNESYRFGVWAASSHPASPARIQFFVNGTMIGEDLQLSSEVGNWQFLSAEWMSNFNGMVDVEIRNFVLDAFVTTFVLDDISFATTDIAEPGIADGPSSSIKIK